MENYKEGDKVYWRDPAGETSGIYTILSENKERNSEYTEEDLEDFDERIFLIGDGNGSENEVYGEELSRLDHEDVTILIN